MHGHGIPHAAFPSARDRRASCARSFQGESSLWACTRTFVSRAIIAKRPARLARSAAATLVDQRAHLLPVGEVDPRLEPLAPNAAVLEAELLGLLPAIERQAQPLLHQAPQGRPVPFGDLPC